MTHMANPHRKMQIRNGRVITKQRWRYIRAYMQKRGVGPGFIVSARTPARTAERTAYRDWVLAFEGFMINGFGPAGKRRSDKRLPGVQVRLAVAKDTRHPNGRE